METEFGLKEKNGELFIRTSYDALKKINHNKVSTNWKLIESALDPKGVEHFFVTEPNQREIKVPILDTNPIPTNLIAPATNITIGDLFQKHQFATLIPQISLAIQKLNFIVGQHNQINKKDSIKAIV